MACLRNKIVLGTLAAALYMPAFAEPLEQCLTIDRPTERLACYDKMLKRTEPGSKVGLPTSVSPSMPPKRLKPPKTKVTTTILTGALKEELPRLSANRSFEREDDITRYTVTQVIRKYGGKVEYLTDNGRRFRKISTSQQNFQVGDVLVAKRGVFEAVFLVNQDGKRIKVKIVD